MNQELLIKRESSSMMMHCDEESRNSMKQEQDQPVHINKKIKVNETLNNNKSLEKPESLEEEFIPFSKPQNQNSTKMNEEPVQAPKLQAQKQRVQKRVDVNGELPIFRVRDEFLTHLDNNQVVVLTGNTGCGKSTQVPQMIYNNARKKGEKCKIICTQPRRLAATSLAYRVADEVGQNIKELVGYQVGMDANFSDRTKILFVTTGIFLQRLVYERESFFEEFTHIIMDEVHERDIDIDFSLIIVKHFIKAFPAVKVVLMSATICAEKFSNYFSKNSISHIDDEETINMIHNRYLVKPPQKEDFTQANIQDWCMDDATRKQKSIELMIQDNVNKEHNIKRFLGKQFLVGEDDIPAPIVSIKQSERFPIYTFYLEQIKEFFKEMNVDVELLYRTTSFFNGEISLQEEQLNIMITIMESLTDPKVMNNINKMYDTPRSGSMLIFLPGYQEIMNVRDMIIERFGQDLIKIVMLHSTITATQKDLAAGDSKQFRVFLCTNIAESSITVPDCLFVIDFCLTKEIEYNAKNLTEKLSLQFCSQASANQRKGRVGRLFPGVCFRMIPEKFFLERMKPYSECEMLRCPLEKIVLKIKKLDQLEQDIIEKAMKISCLVTKQNMKEEMGSEMQNQSNNESVLNQIPLNVPPQYSHRRVLTLDQIKVKDLFSDVGRTLSTALDPPAIDQIGISILNLQQMGAIKMVGDQYKPKLIITNMGLFMCEMPIDIFLTRFIIISCLIGCPQEGVTIAALLSQRRNFFQHPFSRSQELFMDTLYAFDMGDEDDIIIYLRIFQEWEKLFYSPFVVSEQSTQLPNANSNRMQLRRFNRQPYSQKEINYARLRTLDLKTLREVLLQKYELLSRIENYYTISAETTDLGDPEVVLKIKTALAASFSTKAILVQRDLNKDMERRISEIKAMKLEPQRCLTLDNLRIDIDRIPQDSLNQLKDKIAYLFEEYCELHSYQNKMMLRNALIIDLEKNELFKTRKWESKQQDYVKDIARKKAQTQKVWVRGVEFTYGCVIVHFSQKADMMELVSIFKRLLHEVEIERRLQHRKTGKVQEVLTKQINDPKAVQQVLQAKSLEELLKQLNCQVVHTCMAKGYSQPHMKETQADQDSINFIQLCFGVPKKDYEKFMVSYDIKERDASQRNTARQSSRVSWLNGPLQWTQTLTMLFGCNVRLVPNEQKTHYEKVVVDGRTFYLDHYMLEEDIVEFNQVRAKISEMLLQSQGILMKELLWTYLKKVSEMPKTKIHFNADEKWVRVFESDKRQFLRAIQADNSQQHQGRRKRGIALSLLNNDSAGTNIESFKAGFQGHIGKFMRDVIAERPDFQMDYPRQYDQEGLKLFGQMQRLYTEWKQEQIVHCYSLRFLVQRNEKAIFVCKDCENSYDQIGSTRALNYLEEDSKFAELLKGDTQKTAWFRREFQALTLNQFCDRFELCDDQQKIREFWDKKYIGDLLEKLNLQVDPSCYHFLTCPKKEHIFGICPKLMALNKEQINKVLICNRTLSLIYPTTEREEYNFRTLKHESISLKEQEKYNLQQKLNQTNTFECKLCVNEYIDSMQGFKGNYPNLIKHIQSQQHRDNIDLLNLHL